MGILPGLSGILGIPCHQDFWDPLRPHPHPEGGSETPILGRFRQNSADFGAFSLNSADSGRNSAGIFFGNFGPQEIFGAPPTGGTGRDGGL